MAQSNITHSLNSIAYSSILTTIPRRSGLPPFLMTCRDAEQDETEDLTDKATWSSFFLSNEFQQVVKNANFHHKYQEQLIKLLKWIMEHPNENPSIGEFESMLDPVDPNTPNRVRCPRRDCAKVNTRVHIAAHMLQGDHAGLPVYYCVYNDVICQKFFHAADRDRHRENKHQIARPRVARRGRAEEGAIKSKPYTKPPKSTKQNASVGSTSELHIAQPIARHILSQPEPSSSTLPPYLGIPQEPSQAGTAPGVGAAQDSSGAPFNLQSPYAPIPDGQVANIGIQFSSTPQFYQLPSWDQQVHYKQDPPQFPNTSSGNLITRDDTHVAQIGSHQARQNFPMSHQMRVEGSTNSSDATGFYSHSNDPAPIQNGPQFQPGDFQGGQDTYEVRLSESGTHVVCDCFQPAGSGRPHDPFPSLLTDMTLVVLLVFLLGYIYRLDFLYETIST